MSELPRPPVMPRVLVVSGSRTLGNPQHFGLCIERMLRYLGGPRIMLLVEGGARGVDRAAREWATSREPSIPVITVEADWKNAPRAGLERNTRMIQMVGDLSQGRGELALPRNLHFQMQPLFMALWDGQSRGTAHCIGEASADARYAQSRFVFLFDDTAPLSISSSIRLLTRDEVYARLHAVRGWCPPLSND